MKGRSRLLWNMRSELGYCSRVIDTIMVVQAQTRFRVNLLFKINHREIYNGVEFPEHREVNEQKIKRYS